ncbi:Amyloid protein-binding protein 2 [Operophtera brumata]|uniref:Amyloid protein-binding protein 2 n=1 Tax=Operophtera brumata TaxID=104452 RepID=A0A0L7KW90_OPEBR|nr:Amyloid protein-binding protein 2 [Operophtera brumata]
MKRVWFYLSKMAHLRSIGYREVVKTPSRLYELCLTNLVNYLQRCKCDRNMLHTLPDTILIDVYIKFADDCLRFVVKKRPFSAAGYLASKRRSRLADDSLNILCFLRSYFQNNS